MNNINKRRTKDFIIDKIRDSLNKEAISKNIVSAVVNSYIEVLADLSAGQEGYTIPNFGSFKTVQRKATLRINPRTREKISVPAKYTLKFSVSKILKDRMNNK